MKKHYDYLVVGAGLFGATFAREMLDRGKSVLIVDKRNHIGGNVYTEKVEDIYVHKYGAHIFHTSNEKVWDYVNRFVRFNNFINSPVANFRGEMYNLPFNMNTFARMFGISTPTQAEEVLEKERAEISGEPKNLEEQAISLVGRTVYEKLVKGYTEKQWGRDCKDLPAFIIKRIPVRLTYDNNYFNDRFQGIPEGGYTELIEKLIDGADIMLETDYLGEKREELDSSADKVLYTGQLDSYYGHRFGKLDYRSLRFETDILDVPNYQGVAVVNYTAGEPAYTRVIEHKHFMCGAQLENPKTVITREYPATWDDSTEPYYTVNDDKNNTLYEQYKKLAEEDGLMYGGRLADYKYYDMDDTIEAALQLVHNCD